MVKFSKGVFLSTVDFKRHFLQRRGMERDHKDQINRRGEGGRRMGRKREEGRRGTGREGVERKEDNTGQS